MPQPRDGIAIVGPGKVGQALGKLLAAAGFPIRYVAARRLEAARQAGPPESGLSVENTAPFGLSVLTATAEFAAMNKVAWIMDY